MDGDSDGEDDAGSESEGDDEDVDGEDGEDGEGADAPIPGEKPDLGDGKEEIFYSLLCGAAGVIAFWYLGLPLPFGAILGMLGYLVVWYYVLP